MLAADGKPHVPDRDLFLKIQRDVIEKLAKADLI